MQYDDLCVFGGLPVMHVKLAARFNSQSCVSVSFISVLELMLEIVFHTKHSSSLYIHFTQYTGPANCTSHPEGLTPAVIIKITQMPPVSLPV